MTFSMVPMPTLARRTLLASVLAAGVLRGSDPWVARARLREPLAGRGFVPAVLSSSGTVGTVQEPGFSVHHLGLSWSGSARAGRLRLRYADGWHDWRSVRCDDSADGRRRALLWVGPASAYEFVPASSVEEVRLRAINTVDGPPTATTFEPSRRLATLAPDHPARHPASAT